MKLLVISDAPILFENKEKVAYAPYVKEMNMWMKYATSTTYVCPTRYNRSLLTKAFGLQDFEIKSVKRLEFHSLFSAIFSFLSIPYQLIVLCFAFAKADHIHLRCPGNLALLASMVQILFPSKRKTVKYAGNFDPQAPQPMAYQWQKKLLSNTFLTKNIKVLVYGDWPNQTKNIQAFFTASYSRNQIQPVANRNWNGPYKAVFVGTMGANKRPLEVFELIKELRANGMAISLDYYGDGPLKAVIENLVKAAGLVDHISLHGNVDNSIVTQAYKNAHFSFLLSKSEGWPKAVAEAMFWGCIPVASKVSCVPWMLGIATSNFQLPTSNADKETYPLGLGKGMDASSSGSDASSSGSDALSLSKGRERLQNEETYPLGLGKAFDASSSESDASSSESDALSLSKGRERLQNEETYPLGLGKGFDASSSESDVSSSDSDALSLSKGRERLQNEETYPLGLGKAFDARSNESGASSSESDASSSESDALSLSKGRERLQNEETYPLGLGKAFDASSSESDASSSGSDVSSSESDALSLSKGRERLQNKETYPSVLGKGMDATQRGILINDISQAGTLVEEYLKQPELLQQMSQAAAAWSQQYTLDDFEREIALLLKETHPTKASKK